MTYRESYLESRQRYLATYDFEEVSRYDEWISAFTQAEHEACLYDIRPHFNFSPGLMVLDAGAGTGAFCLTLTSVPKLQITALEPCPAMLAKLVLKPELRDLATREGFCDHPDDKVHFAPESFDVIASRQLANGLYDPLAAFRNWHFWLRPAGTVIVMDGLFDRGDWGSRWEGIVDTLPLSACRSLATVPYLLEQAGFQIEFAGWMDATNALPSTRTKRYLVVAKKDICIPGSQRQS